MNNKYVDAFSNAVSNVVSQFGIENILHGERKELGKNIDAEGVVCIIGILGDITGNVMFSMSEEGAKGIASYMMGGMEIMEFDELTQSAVSELSNMLAANACIDLSEQGLNVDISTPTLMQGIFTLSGSYDNVTLIEMSVEAYPFHVYVSLQERAN